MAEAVQQKAIAKTVNQAGDNVFDGCQFNFAAESGLSKLLFTLREKIASEPAAGKFIQDLSDYMQPRPSRTIVGLSEKLEAGGRSEGIEEAEYLKNQFSKKLMSEELSESVQTVYVHVLAKICSAYSQSVYPLIKKDTDHAIVDRAVMSEIITPIYNDIAGACIGITTEHIRGMLYFLTGNCHIKWA